MDTQITTETLKEISERYELYKDIVKIGLGALIGAVASLSTIFIKNKHEFKKMDKEYENQNNKHKLEIKVKILEDCIELTNTFFDVEYKLRNNLYRLRRTNKFYKELNENQKKELANTEEFSLTITNISIIVRKLRMIGANSIADCLYSYYNSIHELREDILMSRKRITFSEEEWKIFNNKFISEKRCYDNLLHEFFSQLK